MQEPQAEVAKEARVAPHGLVGVLGRSPKLSPFHNCVVICEHRRQNKMAHGLLGKDVSQHHRVEASIWQRDLRLVIRHYTARVAHVIVAIPEKLPRCCGAGWCGQGPQLCDPLNYVLMHLAMGLSQTGRALAPSKLTVTSAAVEKVESINSVACLLPSAQLAVVPTLSMHTPPPRCCRRRRWRNRVELIVVSVNG